MPTSEQLKQRVKINEACLYEVIELLATNFPAMRYQIDAIVKYWDTELAKIGGEDADK